MSKEAMKLALEALQECRRDPRLKYEHPTYDKAIKALEEALAKQEQGEPVAWGNLANWCLDSDRVLITDKNAAEKYHRDIYDLTALYTTPQQRTWVGLTTKDQKEIQRQSVYVEGAIRMTEAKLKEKNT
jgi:hypothetical protein